MEIYINEQQRKELIEIIERRLIINSQLGVYDSNIKDYESLIKKLKCAEK